MNAKRLCVATLILLGTMLSAGPAAAEVPADGAQVSTALAKLHQWVGTGKNGEAWRKFLLSGELESELKKGGEADPAVVEKVLEKYESKTAGLDKPQFVAVRTALEAWLAELNLPAVDELADFAQASKGSFTPPEADNVSQAKARLNKAAARVAADLRRWTKSGPGWKKYLEWDVLQSQLKQDAAPDVKQLFDVYRKLTDNKPGLELPNFTRLAAALRGYIDTVAMDGLKEPDKQLDAQLEGLAESLKAYTQQPNEEENWNIGRRLGWLTASRQATDLVRAVRRHHSRPNFFLEASPPLVGAGFSGDVARQVSITDSILGASIRGTGDTKGKLAVAFVPNPNEAAIDLVLKGEVLSRTTGYSSPVTFYSRGTTKFTAQKRVIIDPTGLHAKSASADAQTRNRVYSVSAGRMASRIAWQRIGESRNQADRIASEHAEQRISRRLDREAGEKLAKANRGFLEKFRHPLVRRAEFPEQLVFHTTHDRLHITGMKANRFQIAAPNEPPKVDGERDLAVRVHESMINNMAAALLAGRTLDDATIRKTVINIKGSLPEELKDDQDEDPWSITFVGTKPITITFADTGFTVIVRGRRYTSGERTFQSMNVTAKYKMERAGEGITLTRQGELVIVPPNFDEKSTRLSASQLALRTILERKFGKLFKEKIVSKGLELPGKWKKAGPLRPVELLADGGWLKIGWDMPGDDKVASQELEAATK